MSRDSKRAPVSIDPDIWTVLNLVISGVTMFAQLASLKFQVGATSTLPSDAITPYEKLRDAVGDALRNVEKLIRILGHVENPEILNGRFRFGENAAYLTSARFSQYQQLVMQIALDAGHVSSWTLHLVGHNPATAKMLSDKITDRLGRVSDRINAIYRSDPSNEQVLEDCLMMYRVFSDILSEVDRLRN